MSSTVGLESYDAGQMTAFKILELSALASYTIRAAPSVHSKRSYFRQSYAK
jgi:hypothetical protein